MAARTPGRQSRLKNSIELQGGYEPYVGYTLIIVAPNFPNGERDEAEPHLASRPRERRGVGVIPVEPLSILCATLDTPHSTATPSSGRLPTGSQTTNKFHWPFPDVFRGARSYSTLLLLAAWVAQPLAAYSSFCSAINFLYPVFRQRRFRS